jgi:PmbA protein
MMMVDMVSLAEKTVAKVMRLGVTDCDVMVSDARLMTAEIEKGSVKQASTLGDPGMSIRAYARGSMGFAYCTGHSASSVARAASLAAAMAKAGTPDKDFRGLPSRSKVGRLAGLYDRRVAETSPEQVVERVMDLAAIAGDDGRIYSVNAGVLVASSELALANSNGFSASQRMTSYDVFAEAVAKSGDAMFSGVEGMSGRRLDEGFIEFVGKAARESAVRGLRQTRVATGDYPVVIDPLGLAWILSNGIVGGANAESVQRGRSYLTGKKGSRIGSKQLTISEDPSIEWASGSTAFDGEGTPCVPKKIVEKGVLRTYLHDSYTAGKEGVESTGNSSRGGSVWSYRGPPGISMTNMVVGRGRSSLDEMVHETKDGVYLRLTMDYPNLATGELSGLMMESFRRVKGEMGPALKQSTIGISMFDLLSRIDMVGSKQRSAYGVMAPAVRISKARIAGSG